MSSISFTKYSEVWISLEILWVFSEIFLQDSKIFQQSQPKDLYKVLLSLEKESFKVQDRLWLIQLEVLSTHFPKLQELYRLVLLT